MLFKTLVQASIVGCVLAQPINQHQHHEHKAAKRDIAYVTQTNYVTAGATTATSATAATSEASSDDATETSVASSTEETLTGSGSESSSTSDSTSSSSSSAGALGITYSPYADDGSCKSSSDIASEIAELSGYDIIRLYAVDCDQVGAVLASKTSSQKVFAGIYDMSDIASSVSLLAAAVSSNADWDDIYTVSIGNELVNDGSATVAEIEEYVSTGRSALESAGYTGPVVSVDTFTSVIDYPTLCNYSDYIAVNAHAFFDGGVAAADSGTWLVEQIQRVATACGDDKKVLITETGWPTQGDTNGEAVPSESNQKAAISSIKSSCGDDVLLFTAYNDLWKDPGAYNAEQYWGIYSS